MDFVKFYQKISLVIFSFIILSAVGYAAKSHDSQQSNTGETYLRYFLSKTSTAKNPQYFHCTITSNHKYPGVIKIPPQFIPVTMVNYAQNISRFNHFGRANTNVQFVNNHAWAAIHDPHPLFKNTPGFVDIFVQWFGYDVTCAPGKGGRPLPPQYD